ncbi:MAG: GHKL domain-containing protein, partial [bacterium]|nr:GHKL domain-containing protein [bacterium]
LQNLKDYARPAAPGLTEYVNLDKSVQSAVNLLDNRLKKLTSNFSVHLHGNLPPVKGNSQRLEQVIINLLLNSAQALANTSKGIDISTCISEDSKFVRIIVNDEGEGIPTENLPQLTNPFFTTRRSSGGLGLGLSICASIIKEHTGTMTFKSKRKKGTSVTITLPGCEKDEKEEHRRHRKKIKDETTENLD